MTFGLFGLWAVALVSPGPDVVMVVRQSMVGSRRAGLITAIGVVVGISVWIVVAMLGLSALVDGNPALADALEIAGGCLLAVIGAIGLVQLVRARGTSGRPDAEATGVGSAGAFAKGLLTNIANPKALVFFGALFAQFFRDDTSPFEYAIILAVMLGMALLWFAGVAIAASLRGFGSRYQKAGAAIDLVACTVFLVVGVGMAVAGL